MVRKRLQISVELATVACNRTNTFLANLKGKILQFTYLNGFPKRLSRHLRDCAIYAMKIKTFCSPTFLFRIQKEMPTNWVLIATHKNRVPFATGNLKRTFHGIINMKIAYSFQSWVCMATVLLFCGSTNKSRMLENGIEVYIRNFWNLVWNWNSVLKFYL